MSCGFRDKDIELRIEASKGFRLKVQPVTGAKSRSWYSHLILVLVQNTSKAPITRDAFHVKSHRLIKSSRGDRSSMDLRSTRQSPRCDRDERVGANFLTSASTSMSTTATETTITRTHPAVLKTKTQYAIPFEKYMIPTTWRRFHLSQLINKVLDLPRPVPFDFIINGDMLRNSLGEWCSLRGIEEV